jgi:thiol-disulfide isomerase/thioredoxin
MKPITLSIILLLLCTVVQADTPEPLAIGGAAPAFELPGIDGKTYTLDSFAEAKVLVLVFTCNHCPTAQAYEDRIQQLANDYKDRGVALVAITPNDPLALRLDELGYTDLGDSFEDTVQRAKDKGFTFPYLYDGETQEMSRAYGPVSTPHVFVFDAERKLRYRGRIDNSEHLDRVKTQDAREAIEALLAGEPVKVETTKTSGCSVKWSDKRGSVEESLAKWAKEEVPLEEIDEAGVKELVKNDSDKLRLINVWATWCGPCRIEFPELVTMHRMYRGRDFELITISSDPPGRTPKVHEFLKEQEASTRNFIFADEDSYALIEAVDPDWEGALPYTLLVAPGGEVIYRHMGAIDPLEVKCKIVDYLGRTY